MRIVSDYSVMLQTSTELASSIQKTTKKESESTTSETTTEADKERETYELDTLANMSDEEYEAFTRATANMSEKDKIQAAQSLHLVAKSFEQAQKLIFGGGMLAAMNGDDSYFKNNPDMLNKGIETLSQMSGGDGKAMASFLGRYKGALSSASLNLSV